ncbi:TMEM143 family protein [Pseudocolwellia agarivorans]|uniref:TMEM143 family protein n=1 Tax=Pseudocolwellia agarivorans TaxID=1911682 RepID=UPI0009874B5C|nr:TMEM143 family protein [Pseudocolwellia agarivorans]
MTAERFIPFTKQDVITLCTREITESTSYDVDSFTQVCQILSSLLHFQYHDLLENLKRSYTPFDPNADTRQLITLSDSQIAEHQQSFAENFEKVLNAANFEKITEADIQAALNEESLFKVRLEVAFDDFDEIVFYRRGESQKTEVLRQFFGLKKKSLTFTNYDRVAVYIKFKGKEHFINKQLPIGFEAGATVIKLFQNVPKADLEMLFPNSEIRMRPIDKVIIGASAIVGGAVVLITKLGASLILLATLFAFWIGMSDESVEINQKQLIALALGMGVFGSFIFKEWSKFKNRKIKFMKALADNLYYKNLDNNAGVFHTLVNEAEEEDFKEALIAYTFLLKHPNGLTEQALDHEIEAWFKNKYQCTLDFEVDDALGKLEKLGLVLSQENVYQAIDVNSSKIVLDQHWDKIFQY